MPTALEKTSDHGGDPPRRYLLDRPQALGVLPTWWFWNRPDNWRYVGGPMAAFLVLLMIVLDILAVGPLVYVLVLGASLILATGLVEAYVRRRAIQRRVDANDALGPAEPQRQTSEPEFGGDLP